MWMASAEKCRMRAYTPSSLTRFICKETHALLCEQPVLAFGRAQPRTYHAPAPRRAISERRAIDRPRDGIRRDQLKLLEARPRHKHPDANEHHHCAKTGCRQKHILVPGCAKVNMNVRASRMRTNLAGGGSLAQSVTRSNFSLAFCCISSAAWTSASSSSASSSAANRKQTKVTARAAFAA